MSTGTPPSAHDGHLDDDAALDALDGALDPVAAAHLEACPACTAEVAALEAVRAAVAAPVAPVDHATREAAIAAALAAQPEVAPPGAPSTSGVAATRRPVDLGLRRAARWESSTTLRWLGAAAAVVLLALAVPLLASTGDDDADTAAGVAEESAGGGADDQAATMAAPAAPLSLGDLGAISPEEDLAPALERALGAPPPAAADQPEGSAGGEDGDEADEAGRTVQEPALACQEALRAERPDLGPVVATGTATVDGAPAVVLAFRDPGAADATLQVVVARAAGCEALSARSYPHP